jgi:hypothetical protein
MAQAGMPDGAGLEAALAQAPAIVGAQVQKAG